MVPGQLILHFGGILYIPERNNCTAYHFTEIFRQEVKEDKKKSIYYPLSIYISLANAQI
jgi:hypothetical protein